jgi:hypothetical protein
VIRDFSKATLCSFFKVTAGHRDFGSGQVYILRRKKKTQFVDRRQRGKNAGFFMYKVGKGDKILFGAFGRNSIIHSFIY